MSNRPIFLVAHPRSRSSAFERMFMTQGDKIQCVHEPFSEAFYLGPERLSARFSEEAVRTSAVGGEVTYRAVLERLEKEREAMEQIGKRLFIKDMAYFLIPADNAVPYIAPSFENLLDKPTASDVEARRPKIGDYDSNGPAKAATDNPAVIPLSQLENFHFTFLIRHPRLSIPSYYRCTIPPLSIMTGVTDYQSNDAGYSELRRLFDYLRSKDVIGPFIAGREYGLARDTEKDRKQVQICVVDAEDLLQRPESIMRSYCTSVQVPFSTEMFKWVTDGAKSQAEHTFAQWKGFHEDAINSRGLCAASNAHRHNTRAEDYNAWTREFGHDAAGLIQSTVDANLVDYEYLKQFAMKL